MMKSLKKGGSYSVGVRVQALRVGLCRASWGLVAGFRGFMINPKP